MKLSLSILLLAWLLLPAAALAEEEQFIVSLDTKISSVDQCLSAVWQNEKKIIKAIVEQEEGISGSSFYQESAQASFDLENGCLANLQIVSDHPEIQEGKVISKKEWACSATFEEPKFNSAGQSSCASVLLEVKKEADQVKINVTGSGDVFLTQSVVGAEQVIEHREPHNVPWWYYIGALVVLVVIFPAITIAYGRVARNRDNEKRPK